MKRLLLLWLLIAGTTTATAQTWQPHRPADCTNGRCRRIPADRPQAPSPDKPPASIQAHIARARGYCALRVITATGQRLGSGVCAGQGPLPGQWVLLSAGHIFNNLDSRARIEVQLEEHWHDASLLRSDLSPDRALLTVQTSRALHPASIPPASVTADRVIMIGYPRGGDARAFAGHVTDVQQKLAWIRLDRSSHYDCLNGTSGGGVYDAAGRLIGIQSCADSIGTVETIGFTPLAAWDDLFAELGWSPRGWGRGATPPQLTQPERGPRGVRGERGPAGPAGPAVTPQQIEQALAAYLAQYPPQFDQQRLEAAIARALQSHTPAVDLGAIHKRLDTLEQRIEEPFQVQLFNTGTKVGSPRSVHPHGGYLPLDVFGEIETLAGPSKGE